MEVKDLYDINAVKTALKSCFSSKQLGYEDFLAELVGSACSKLTSIRMKKFRLRFFSLIYF